MRRTLEIYFRLDAGFLFGVYELGALTVSRTETSMREFADWAKIRKNYLKSDNNSTYLNLLPNFADIGD